MALFSPVQKNPIGPSNEQLSKFIVFLDGLDAAHIPRPLMQFVADSKSETSDEVKGLEKDLARQGDLIELSPSLKPLSVMCVLIQMLERSSPLIPVASYDLVLLTASIPDKHIRRTQLLALIETLDLVVSDLLSLFAKFVETDENLAKELASFSWQWLLRPKDPFAAYVREDGQKMAEAVKEMILACDNRSGQGKGALNVVKKK